MSTLEEVGCDMSSDEMLRQILRKQEESLDLKGQLVILNEKMDTLIETMERKIKSQSTIAAVFEASPQMPLYAFIIMLVAMFLGFGPEMVGLLQGGG
jgi:hypothetical protein